MELHGGKLTCESELHIGSTFTVQIPFIVVERVAGTATATATGSGAVSGAAAASSPSSTCEQLTSEAPG